MLTNYIITAAMIGILILACMAWVNRKVTMKGIIAGLLIAGALAWFTYKVFNP